MRFITVNLVLEFTITLSTNAVCNGNPLLKLLQFVIKHRYKPPEKSIILIIINFKRNIIIAN